MDASPQTATRILGDFVAGTNAARLPPDLLELAKLCLIDTIGAMAAGLPCPGPRAVVEFATQAGGGDGACSVMGSSRRVTASMAALANGTMAHTQEIDDVHDESLTHPGAVVVPAALAIAEECGASGSELLCAIVLGYELAARAGLGVGAVRHMLKGYYPTGTSCVFGSAAASGKLLGLDADRLVAALGIAASFASGITEYAQSGGEVKWLHAGRASEGGVTAAHLARSGLSAPTTGLEGRFGFCRTFSDAPRPERLLEDLGKDFKIRAITVKPYACCSDMHAVIDAMLELMTRNDIRLDTVRNVAVESSTKLLELNNIDGTRSIMAAKYSVPFTIGLTLTRDIRDPSIYNTATLADPELRSFQQRVRMTASERFDALFPRTIAARVEVELVDGRRLSAENHGARGSIHRPLTAAETRSKFVSLSSSVFSPEQAQEILSLVDALDTAQGVEKLTACLRQAAGGQQVPSSGSHQERKWQI